MKPIGYVLSLTGWAVVATVSLAVSVPKGAVSAEASTSKADSLQTKVNHVAGSDRAALRAQAPATPPATSVSQALSAAAPSATKNPSSANSATSPATKRSDNDAAAASAPSDGSTPTWFWAGFWPNLASTIIGVILGLPFAVLASGWAQRFVNRKTDRDAQNQLRVGLALLLAAIDQNTGVLKTYSDTLVDDRILVYLDLDLAAWEATRASALSTLQKPALYRRAAMYFDRTKGLLKLSQAYVDSTVGLASSLNNSASTAQAIRGSLNDLLAHLSDTGPGLRADIAKEIDRLG